MRPHVYDLVLVQKEGPVIPGLALPAVSLLEPFRREDCSIEAPFDLFNNYHVTYPIKNDGAGNNSSRFHIARYYFR